MIREPLLLSQSGPWRIRKLPKSGRSQPSFWFQPHPTSATIRGSKNGCLSSKLKSCTYAFDWWGLNSIWNPGCQKVWEKIVQTFYCAERSMGRREEWSTASVPKNLSQNWDESSSNLKSLFFCQWKTITNIYSLLCYDKYTLFKL